jgi:hypothetical protein
MAGLAPPTQNAPSGHVAHCALVALKNDPVGQFDDDDDCADTRPGPQPPPPPLHHSSSTLNPNQKVAERRGCGVDGQRTVRPADDGGTARVAGLSSRAGKSSISEGDSDIDARDGLGGGERRGQAGARRKFKAGG